MAPINYAMEILNRTRPVGTGPTQGADAVSVVGPVPTGRLSAFNFPSRFSGKQKPNSMLARSRSIVADMPNPYQSPEATTNEDKPASFKWPFSTKAAIAVLVSIIFAAAIDLPSRLTNSAWTSFELRMWLVFASSIAMLAFTLPTLKEKFPNLVSVASYCLAIAGLLGLTSCLGLLIELYMAWYSGVEVKRFALHNSMFGRYAYVYWINHAALCLLPLFICWHGVAKRRWLIIPALVTICLVAAANLRFSYLFNRDEIPSSWSQFFW